MTNSFTIGKTYHGFKLTQQEEVTELNAICRVFRHNKSGAELFYMSNSDSNKLFSITFKTLPYSNNGIAHIMEHSVLCGSRKFPVKEPMMHMEKGSLNTIFGAWTNCDETQYAAASTNSGDLQNLMDVLLDAVFYPNLLHNPLILQQEGAHPEIDKKNGKLKHVGVVHSEMQGHYASTGSILREKNTASLYPDTCYQYSFGGHPDAVPELTQEEFVDFHAKYYHPSNAKIFLYGDGNMLEHLEFINNEYLLDFTNNHEPIVAPRQDPFSELKEVEHEVAIPEQTDTKSNYHFSLNFSFLEPFNAELSIASLVLNAVLGSSSSSPLKQALQQANIGMNIGSYIEKNILQPYMSIYVQRADLSKKSEFVKTVNDVLHDLVKNGIDRDILKSVMSMYEFFYKEADMDTFPMGMFYEGMVYRNLKHDLDPIAPLKTTEIFEKLKQEIDNGYFEKLITKYFLNNHHKSLVVLKPVNGLTEQRALDQENKLAIVKKGLTPAELAKINSLNEQLQLMHDTPDTKAAIEKMPSLDLALIRREIEQLPCLEKNMSGAKIFLHDLNSSNITYLQLYFDLNIIPQQLLPCFSLFTSMLKKVATSNYNRDNLTNTIQTVSGGLNIENKVFSSVKNTNFSLKHIVKAKLLNENLGSICGLISEITQNSQFSNKNTIFSLLQEQKNEVDELFDDYGDLISINRMQLNISGAAKTDDLMKYLSYKIYLDELLTDFDTKFAELQLNFKMFQKMVYNKNNLVISYSSAAENLITAEHCLSPFIAKLNDQEYPPATIEPAKSKSEAILTNSNVLDIAQGFNFKQLGYPYDGGMQILKTILSGDYLYEKIRLAGGAYGAECEFLPTGDCYLFSYKDPKLTETLAIFNKATDFIEHLDLNNKELQNLIISVIGKMDLPLTPSMIGETAAAYYFTGMTEPLRQQERDEVFSFRTEKFKEYADMLRAVVDQNNYCVFGNGTKIKENSELFNTMIHI